MAAPQLRATARRVASIVTMIAGILAAVWRQIAGAVAAFFGWDATLKASRPGQRPEDLPGEQQRLLERQRRERRRPIAADLGHLLAGAERGAAKAAEPRLRFPCPGSSAVRLVQGVLSEGECRGIAAAARGLGFSAPAQFSDRTRVCERVHTVDAGVSAAMLERLRAYVPEEVVVDGARWRLTRFTHHWRYVRYFKGGHFAPHYDGAKLLPWHEMSMFTVQIYLNSAGLDFEGGDTHFFMDYRPQRQGTRLIEDGSSCDSFPPAGELVPTASVRPVAGDVLVFDHAGRSVFHSGGSVTSGSKYIMRGDLLYAAVPEDIPRLLMPTLPVAERTWCPETAGNLGTRDYTGQVWLCDCAADQHGASCCAITREPAANLCRPCGGAPRRGVLVAVAGQPGPGQDYVVASLEASFAEAGLRARGLAAGAAGAAGGEGVAAALRMLEEGAVDAVVAPAAGAAALEALRRGCGAAAFVPLRLAAAAEEEAHGQGAGRAWAAAFDCAADVTHGLLDEWLRHTAAPRALAAAGRHPWRR